VSELRLLSQSAFRYRRQILSLKQFLAARACTTLLLDDLTSADSRDDRQLESVCHGVIALRRDESAYGAERRHMSIRKIRGSTFLGGPHDYVIETGGVKVFPRIVPKNHRRDFVREPVSCGIEGMDILLGGGMDRGTSNLLIGPSGTGKSSLAITYAHSAVAQGERAALFTFVVVSSGQEALEAIKDLHPDVLLCDLAMPGMDGYEVLESVRRREPEVGWLPVIAFTAAARDADRAATRRAGFPAHLAKPIEPETLVRTVLEVISCKNEG
jgi:CheY-like chemotaxis protein